MKGYLLTILWAIILPPLVIIAFGVGLFIFGLAEKDGRPSWVYGNTQSAEVRK